MFSHFFVIWPDLGVSIYNVKCLCSQPVVSISCFIIVVGFHTTLAPTMSSLVLEGLTSRLADRLAVEKVDLVRQPYSGNTDYCWPLLVVCVNVSRIGADAKEALKGIPKGWFYIASRTRTRGAPYCPRCELLEQINQIPQNSKLNEIAKKCFYGILEDI